MPSIRRMFPCFLAVLIVVSSGGLHVWAQAPKPEDAEQIRARLTELQKTVAELRQTNVIDRRLLADVEVYAKAADWILRHNEFYQPRYAKDTIAALETGLKRAEFLATGQLAIAAQPTWLEGTGSRILGYYSAVDNSVQPYALSLPEGIDRKAAKRWPLYVVLHGRGGTRNEVRFIRDHDGKKLPPDQTWLQLDVFGRTDNAYRFSGETDVFEAIADVQRRFRIDDKRITLWGFSMGGAGAWHLGMHHPSMWSSVGPGAGFVDFYKYQKQSEQRPEWQHSALHIYDAIDYAMNAFNVPVCTYGGELDAQLAASTQMVEQAGEFDVPIKLLIGPGMGHKFHPESRKEFMAFHREHSQQGRKPYPGNREIRFTTYTLKYNKCEWLTIEEMLEVYEPTTVEGGVDPISGILKITTENVAALQIARDVADRIEIDGDSFPLSSAAGGLLPDVYFENDGTQWTLLDYDASRKFSENPELHKRHDLQGPIDDAFMQPFVCVRGTGEPWSTAQQEWAQWTLSRFAAEFDKWLRGRIPVVDDRDVTEAMIADKNLILFGDPGSNILIKRVLDKLPIRWTEDAIEIDGKSYDPATSGVSLIYPNPLSPNRYVVINSGHTMHEKDFKASNSWLFPRLGDIAVQEFKKRSDGSYEESILWAELFNSSWQLP